MMDFLFWITILAAIAVASRRQRKAMKDLTDAIVEMQAAYNKQVEWTAMNTP